MLIKIWDFFFTRKVWTTIKEIEIYESEDSSLACGRYFIMKDQFGNIKRKKINF